LVEEPLGRPRDSQSVSPPHVRPPLNSEALTSTTTELSLLPEGSEARVAWGKAQYTPRPEPGKSSVTTEVSEETPSTADIESGKRPRVIERGMLKCPGMATFWIQAESFPLWLLALGRSFVRAIHLIGGSDAKSYLQEMRSRGCDLSLKNLVLGRIGLGKVHYSNLSRPAPQDPSDIVLISGSLEYVRRHSQLATNPTLVLCEAHIRGNVTKFGGTFWWFHLRHASFGGSTSFKAFLGTNIETFQPERTKLRRTIAHILDHGIRPKARHVDFKEAIPASRLLHPHSLQDEVMYRSSFTATGWGSRQLTVDELGVAFGFPSWLRRGLTPESFPVVPIQILDRCLRGILPQITSQQVLPTITIAAPVVASTKTWLPALQKFLPNSWIDSSVVTSKAAKRDDALAPTQLWDARSVLVLPHLERALPLLWRILMR
jgi:hypothetical protein